VVISFPGKGIEVQKMKSFDYWKKLHESEKLEEFSSDTQGLLWLKVKSIVRKEIISDFVSENKIELK
jgi:hypothetical protein